MGGRLVKVSSAFPNEISSNYHQSCQTSKCWWIIRPRSLAEIIFQPTTTKNWCWSQCVMALRLMEKLFPFALNLFKIARNIKSITRYIKLLGNHFLERFCGNLRMHSTISTVEGYHSVLWRKSSTVKGYHHHCRGLSSALLRDTSTMKGFNQCCGDNISNVEGYHQYCGDTTSTVKIYHLYCRRISSVLWRL